MSIQIEELLYRIAGDAKELDKELRKSEKDIGRYSKKSKKSLGGLRSELGNLHKRFIRLNGVVAGLVGAAGFGAFLKMTIDSADKTAKFADRLGMSTEALSRLRYAAKLTGVESSQLDMGLQRMTRRLAEAAQGSGEAKDAIAELGLDAGELVKLAPEETFMRIAERLKTIPNQADRVRIAFKLFDSEGVALVNTLAKGRDGLEDMFNEADRLGVTLDQKTARQAEEFNDNLERMKGLFTGIGYVLLNDILPPLNTFNSYLLTSWGRTNSLNDNLDDSSSILRTFTERTLLALVALNALGKTIAEGFDWSGGVVGDISGDKYCTNKGVVEKSKESWQQLKDMWQEVLDFQYQIELSHNKSRSEKDGITLPVITSGSAAPINMYEQLLKQMERELTFMQQRDQLSRTYWELNDPAGKYFKLTKEQKESIKAKREEIEGIRELMLAEKERAEAEKAFQAELQNYRDLAVSDMQLLKEEIAKITGYWMAGLIDLNTYIANLARLQDEMGRLGDKGEGTGKIFADMGKQMGGELQQTLAMFLFDPFQDGLDEMVLGFFDAMRQMLAQATAMAMLKSLLGGTALGTFLGFAEGGPVYGPGTSTSDSIPARLSDGEFIQPTNAVDYYGLPFMESIRKREFPFIRPFTSSPTPAVHFAKGGLAQSGSGGGVQSIRFIFVDERTPYEDFMTSSAGDRVLVQSIQRNANPIGKVFNFK
jgi:hypothetical protein